MVNRISHPNCTRNITWAHVTLTHVMLRLQLRCERRFTIEFYGADSHFCHSVYVTWSHVPARLSYFCCTHFVRRDDVTYVSSALQTLSISRLQKNILFISAATVKQIRLECYLPRLLGTKSSHEITWHDDMRVCRLTWIELTWREHSVSQALEAYVNSTQIPGARSPWRMRERQSTEHLDAKQCAWKVRPPALYGRLQYWL